MTDSFLDENSIKLTDENGKEFRFSLLDLIEYEGGEYAVLIPGEKYDGRVTILKVEDVNGDSIADYISVDDPAVVEAVFDIFKKKVEEASKA